jgi:hypothetical protein
MVLLQLSESNMFGREVKKLQGVLSEEKRLLLLLQFGKFILEDFKRQLLERLSTEDVKDAWNRFFKHFRNKKADVAQAILEDAKDDLPSFLSVARDEHAKVINIFLDNFNVDEEEVPITDIFKVLEHGASDLSPVKLLTGLQSFYVKNFEEYWKEFLGKFNLDIDEMLTASFMES